MSSRSGPLGAGRHLFAVPDVGATSPEQAPAATSALAQVMELAARSASGELVCSCAGGEIHVFLQEGRIAWASSSRQRRAFTEHLKKLTGAEDEALEAVVSECARTRRPIGEGLIACKLATAEQVRASLLHQIRMALASAADEADARTLFLERSHYRRYDRTLTFPLGEVFAAPEPPARPPSPATAGAAPRVQPGADGDPATALAGVDGFSAAAVLSARGEALAIVGDGERLREVASLSHRLLQDGQRLAIELGAGLCRQVHVAADDGHLLVYSTRRTQLAPGPGAWLRVVLLLRHLRGAAVARERIGALAAAVEPEGSA